MATTTHTITTDDLTGEEGASTRTFALAGKTYEIDLTDESWDHLINNSLADLLTNARPVKGGPNRAVPKFIATGSTNGGSSNGDTAAIRAWARAHGHVINDRGRLPGSIVTAYAAALDK